MSEILLWASDSPAWLQDLLQPRVLPFLVAIIAVGGGLAVAIVKLIVRHRERMAKIEHGIDPDAGTRGVDPETDR